MSSTPPVNQPSAPVGPPGFFGRPSPSLFNRPAFKVAEVAALLGVCPSTVRRMIRRGQLRPCRALRHLLIPADQVHALLQT